MEHVTKFAKKEQSILYSAIFLSQMGQQITFESINQVLKATNNECPNYLVRSWANYLKKINVVDLLRILSYKEIMGLGNNEEDDDIQDPLLNLFNYETSSDSEGFL
ncbi:60S ACIDIC ribosomal protein P1 [Anaeramoeba flamelloides]|uniref:60S ACIDIC ribosomal protein P1 n=1 Tax=Anaeramoeba flamelloides TaxID=1746091 RepID=A0AAV8A3P6_9EUKA|nr:60S ACIDIC ribosomal protein P1 [Anaeramoeba flamelloides]